MKIRSIILSAAALLAASSAQAQINFLGGPKYEFTTVKELPITSIKNQYRSGTCWCFSALSFIESEILREKGISVDLSEMFVVGNSYRDRAVKYVRLDGHLNFGAGSSFGDVLHVIQDYGIVPQDAMPGMNYGTEMPEQAELDAALKGYVEAIAKNPNKTLTTAWLNGFDGIVEAYLGAYPTEFEACDGSAEIASGVVIGQQARKAFGLCYKTVVGNDVKGNDLGYKIHLIYGCKAAPSEKAFQTINDSPEAITFSWEVTTTPVNVEGFKPTSTLVIDSTKVDAEKLAAIEAKLFGSESEEASLPLPDEIVDMMK